MRAAERRPAASVDTGAGAAAVDGGMVGEQRMSDGEVVPLDVGQLAAPLDGALSVLWIALALLAAGVVAVRL